MCLTHIALVGRKEQRRHVCLQWGFVDDVAVANREAVCIFQKCEYLLSMLGLCTDQYYYCNRLRHVTYINIGMQGLQSLYDVRRHAEPAQGFHPVKQVLL